VENVNNMKYLITSGCSFTSHERVNLQRGESDFLKDHLQFWYHTHWIKTLRPELEVFNMGSPGNGNLTIARSALYKAKQLLNSGVDGSEISIIIQWSNFHRKSYFVSNEIKHKAPIDTHENYANDFINDKSYNGEKGYWLTMACPDMDKSSFVDLNPKMFKFNQLYLETLYNDEERFIEWLDYFDYVITFCELHNIKLKCFFMHNPFSSAYHYGMLPSDYKNGHEMIQGMFVDRKIHNTWNETEDDIINRFPWGANLYKQIDWKKYCWFFEEEGLHKNGGVLEWALRNQIPSTDEDFNPLYQEYWQYGSQSEVHRNIIEGNAGSWGHVGHTNYKKFTEEIILKWDMFK
jgi:hypothetical protein